MEEAAKMNSIQGRKQAMLNKKLGLSLVFLLFISCSYAQKRKTKNPLDELAVQLTEKAGNDSLKVLAIYDWVTVNIGYDYKTFMGGEPIRYQSAELVYEKRKTTCSGYTNLMLYLLGKVGIPAFEIEGYAADLTLGMDTVLLYSDHSWLAFKMNGEWKFCDATWDAGSIGFIELEKEEIRGLKRVAFLIRHWKFWHIFWSRERKEREAKKGKRTGIAKLEKINFKVGFIANPKKDYLFVDPNIFSKTHLSSVAHWQMNPAPIGVAEFCDSMNLLNDDIQKREGNFNFNILNDRFFKLSMHERELWMADSVLAFNPSDYGDKAIHLHRYMSAMMKNQNFSKEQVKALDRTNDSLIKNVLLAQKIIRNYNFDKKKMLSQAFAKERTSDKKLVKSAGLLETFMLRTPTIYAKGRQKTLLGEKKKLDYMEIQSSLDFTLKDKTASTAKPDSLLFIKQLKLLKQHGDTIRKLCLIESSVCDSLLIRLKKQMDSTVYLFLTELKTAKSNTYLLENEVLDLDKRLNVKLTLLQKMLNDSINKLFYPQRSMFFLQQYEKELVALKARTSEWRTATVTDSISVYGKLFESLIALERKTMAERLEDSKRVEKYFKETLLPYNRFFKLAAGQLNLLKTKRQKYLYDYQNMKYKRVTKVYTEVGKWSKIYKAMIRELKKNQL